MFHNYYVVPTTNYAEATKEISRTWAHLNRYVSSWFQLSTDISTDHKLGNWPDVPGIFSHIRCERDRTVVLADRGLGILATLQRVRPQLANAEEALKVAFTERISGRYPETRGNGLKFVRSVIIQNPFTLDFRTGDASLNLKKNDTDIIIKQTDTPIRGCFAIIGFESLI